MRILGVDPGSRLTGYGCVDWIQNRIQVVTHGTLKLANTSGKATIPLEVRLLSIYHGLSDVIQELKPDVLVIEKVFFAKNAVSALKLGQARGAAILTGMIHALEIVEYSSTEVKRAVVGQGHADKDQVAKMLELRWGKQSFETSDSSDGLALAVCHCILSHRRPVDASAYVQEKSRQEFSKKNSFRKDYGQDLRSSYSRRNRKGTSLAEAIGIDASAVSGKRRVAVKAVR